MSVAGQRVGSVRPAAVSRGRTRTPGPEGVAAALAAVVILLAVVLGGGSPGGGPGSGAVEPSASPSPEGSAVAPQPSRLVDRATADLLISVNQQLIEAGGQLAAGVERATGRTTELATLVREVNATARFGAGVLPALGSTPEARDLIERLGPIYGQIRTIADETLRASINNVVAYELGATRLIEVIALLPPFQVELETLRDAVVVASVPPASVSPTIEPGDASPTGPLPTDPPSAPPSDVPPTPTPRPTIAPSQVVNGGFEDGVATAWRLVVADGAMATLSDDRVAPAAGSISARVELGTSTAAYASVSLQQAGIRLDAGASYTISVTLRSEAPRDVRVRVASADGDAYLTRIAVAGPIWMVSTFTFLAPASDDRAVIQIDLGRSDATTWIDDVVLRPSTAP